jgi:PAS domain S-box-containing protein
MQYIISGIFLLTAQALIIIALLWQRAERRKTEAELVRSNERLRSAMETVRESQNRLEGIVASAMDAIIAVGQDQRIVVFNDAAETMFACPASDAIGTPIDHFIQQPFRAAHGEHFHPFGEAGVTNRAMGALWALRANGEEFPIDATISHTEVGGEKLFTVIIRDITERKQAEEARFRHAAILESSDDAIISLDLDGVIVSWNIGALHMYGYTEQDALGQPVAMIIPPELREEEGRLLRRVIAGKLIEHNETVRLTKEGKHIDVSLTLSPLRNWAGQIIGVSTIARDITLSRLAEASLRESEERFRLVANTAPVMIWMSGPDKLFTYFNQPWLKFTGRSIQEELGNGWAVGVHSEDLEQCLDTYRKAFDRREPFDMEYRLRRHDGEYRWVFDLGVPRWNADGSLAGYIGSCLDVTDRKRAEEALSTVSRRLIEAHEEERSWIARELHDDINQQIALLAVNLERLKVRLPTSAAAASQGLAEIGQQISDIASNVQALSHRLHSSRLEYLGIAVAACSFCKELSEKQGVEIEFHSEDLPKNLPQEIALCLYRVLQEALQNAVKHSGSQQLEVSLLGALNAIQLTVHDSGIGFDPEDAIRGRGLGLISMKERLKLVDGELSIESQPEIGTTIHASVPLNRRTQSAGA